MPETNDVAGLLAQAGIAGPFQLVGLPGGGNNRVFRVDSAGGCCLLKAYFWDPEDGRDRLAADFGFCSFAWDRGLRCLPRPLAQDRQSHLGLYEFLEGRALGPEEIGAGEVQQAGAFFRELNHHKSQPAARALSYGSEACLTLGQHLACVDRRLANFARIDANTPCDREARCLIDEELGPAWARVSASVVAQSAAAGFTLDEPILRADECLSPSDFGFHNALRTANGTLRFFDFEYAGWDDPAKTVCDFFCQPARPVHEVHTGMFAREVVADLSDPEVHLRRISLLLPVYRLKWCCIMLNEFLPVGSRRRTFAQPPQDREERKQQQLEKVRSALRKLQ